MKVAIYCRVSTDEQELMHQHNLCQEYVDRMGYTTYLVYKDVISGTTTSRTGFNLLLEDMRKFKFDAIVVSKLDRIGRSLSHLLCLIDEFTQKGIHFISVTQNLETNTSSGKLLFQIMGAFAEYERNIISERTKEALKGNTRVGKRGKDKKVRKQRGGLKKPILFVKPKN